MYLIDSDVLIDAKNRHYAFDIVPAFWDWLAKQHASGVVYVVQAVYDEIVAGDDELADWIKDQPATFRTAPTAEDRESLAAVSAWANGANYRAAAKAEFLQKGDYFNVAQALTRDFVVVTQERPDPASQRRIKIPDACDALGVEWCSPFEMLRREGAQFGR